MIDAASEHYKADPLTMPASYHARGAGKLSAAPGIPPSAPSRCMRPRRVAHHDQVALVVLARVVAKGGMKVARRVPDPHDLAADRRAVHVHVERRHEDRHAMVALARRASGSGIVGNVGHLAVGARTSRRFRMRGGQRSGSRKKSAIGDRRGSPGSRRSTCMPSTITTTPAANASGRHRHAFGRDSDRAGDARELNRPAPRAIAVGLRPPLRSSSWTFRPVDRSRAMA